MQEPTIDIEFWAVRNRQGQWLRTKGYQGDGPSWVDALKRANIWTKPGPAKAQVTWWTKNHPDYGAPDLIRLSPVRMEVIDQTDRAQANIRKAELTKVRRNIRWLQSRQSRSPDQDQELQTLRTRLAELTGK